MMKCKFCRTKTVHVEQLRESESGPVIAIIHRCNKCNTILKRKMVKHIK